MAQWLKHTGPKNHVLVDVMNDMPASALRESGAHRSKLPISGYARAAKVKGLGISNPLKES
jgi:hypothetical protein